MKLPKRAKKALNSASGLSKCYVNDQYTQLWLCDNLGLVTDDNEHDLGDFVVDFCWIQQKWFVK